jgi:hypothetical protein
MKLLISLLAKTGHGPHSSTLVAILFRLLFVFSVYCLGANVYCHRVTTQLQLINIIIIIIIIIIIPLRSLISFGWMKVR